MTKLLFLVTYLGGLTAPLIANPWLANMADAQKEASSSKKDLLIYFSGSSWDKLTKKWEKDVISHEDFLTLAPNKFVLLNYDFPKNPAADPASKPKLEIAKNYQVSRIPTIILADKDGRPYATVGSNKATVPELLKTLDTEWGKGDEFKKRLAAAEKKNGVAKAEELVTALQLVSKASWKTHYQAELDAIKASDTEGKTGFIAKIESEDALKKENIKFRDLFRAQKFAEVIALAEDGMKSVKGEDAQRLSLFKIQALAAQKKYDKAKGELDAMVKLAPDSENGKSKERYLKIIDQMKVREERKAKAIAEAKNKPKSQAKPAKPSGPIVSKPVAVVANVGVLHAEVKKLEEQLKKAEEAKAAKAKEAKAAEEAHAKLVKQLAAMKDVVKTHEEMDARKQKASDLEKKAKELEAQAAKLKKEAAEVKKGK